MRASRFFIALGILAAGICAAWPFRRSSVRLPRPPAAAIVLDVSLRGKDVMLEPSPPGEDSPAAGLNAESTLRRTPLDAEAVSGGPPDLAKLAPPPPMPLAFAAESPAAAASPPQPRTYRLRDGDSLEWLAERYLGSRERADDLFAANRDVLAQPDLLPVGTTIKIPPRDR